VAVCALGCGSSGSSSTSFGPPGADTTDPSDDPSGGGSGSHSAEPSTGSTSSGTATESAGASAAPSSGSTSTSTETGAYDASVSDPNSSEADILTAGIWDDGLNYSFFTSYLAKNNSMPGSPGFSVSDFDASHTEFATRSPHAHLDATLVIDTTGSMSDELSYLTAEFANITSAVSSAFPSVDQRWALVVYRDRPNTDPGDDYVVKSYDFTSDMGSFAATVSAQTAANGGDYPESPDLGLEQMQQLSWRSDSDVAKLAFWVGDAPDHVEYASELKQAIVDAHTAGIHIYPVSGSGTDDLLELSMRSAAAITGGRYMFLTDDSGVGDPHKTPEIPCYFVTKLAKDLVRAISMEVTATYIGPTSSDIIRTVGDPSAAGQCPINDGGTVQIF
jgi:hypothetical protein